MAQAQAALRALDGASLLGRPLSIKLAVALQDPEPPAAAEVAPQQDKHAKLRVGGRPGSRPPHQGRVPEGSVGPDG